MTTLLGIILGLSSAASQTFAYIASRLYLLKHKNTFWKLLLVSHIFTGVAALLLLPLAWSPQLPPLRTYIMPLLGSAGFYLLGQACLFIIMRVTSPSRLVPLLGTKIIILAILATSIFGKTISPLQWIAVLACFSAVVTLNFSGGSLPIRVLALLLVTCTGYSLSDLNIDRLVRALSDLPTLHAAVWGGLATYVLLGIVAAIIFPMTKQKSLFTDWKLSLPFAGLWLIAMLTLYTCIGFVGPVLAIILQSTRGLMSVALGAILAHRGLTHVEKHVPRRILIQRAAAAILMIAAISLYASSQPQSNPRASSKVSRSTYGTCANSSAAILYSRLFGSRISKAFSYQSRARP